MSGPADVLFLVDVDNTLLDNDRVIADLKANIAAELDAAECDRYWAILEKLRGELGYVDYLGAFQQFRMIDVADPRRLLSAQFLLGYPFDQRLYPGASAVVQRLRGAATTMILSDGDAVYQSWKIHRSGLWNSVDGRVLIYVHKEQMLDILLRRHPAGHYVMIDDKPHILETMKQVLGNRVTTVFARQGHYALDPAAFRGAPPPDVTVDRIGDLLDLPLTAFTA